MAMVQLDASNDLSDNERKEINEMCEALALFKAAVDALVTRMQTCCYQKRSLHLH